MDDATPPNPYMFPTSVNPLVIAGGQSAKVCFEFTPPITQRYSGQATLVTTDPSGTNPILELTGWGGGPQISCSPPSLDFGSVVDGGSVTLPVTCTNTGTAIPETNLIIDPPIAGPAMFDAQFDTTHPYPLAGLAPGASAQIDVIYTPAAAENDTGTLSIPSNGGRGLPIEIPLTGSGIL
jgi:hypothetical protein